MGSSKGCGALSGASLGFCLVRSGLDGSRKSREFRKSKELRALGGLGVWGFRI